SFSPASAMCPLSLHAALPIFLASNTTSNDYYPALAEILFRLAVRLNKATGAKIKFINLSGGVGVDYRPEEPASDIASIGEGVRRSEEHTSELQSRFDLVCRLL